MAFLEDPRLRQRWNQISHTTETVTENAAAGIWSFGHTYVNPCFGSIASALEGCTSVCLGDREERARRRRERERARGNAEYSFDFYDDWNDDLADGTEDHGGVFRGWRHEDWDGLLAGKGKGKKGGAGEVHEQPRTRKRGMSYGTRGARRKSSDADDPTIIPSTQPIGFLGRLPFRIGGTLRYKPSAANLQEHPGRHDLDGEHQPLLRTGDDDADDYYHVESPSQNRKRSGTTGSGDTSDSYRSRGDLFPSDEEMEEDAVPLDDEFAVALEDRASNRTRSSKGKRIESYGVQRSASRTTLDSTYSRTSLHTGAMPISFPQAAEALSVQSLENLQDEEERIRQEEDEEVERKRQAAAQLALERGLHRDNIKVESGPGARAEMVEVDDIPTPERAEVAEIFQLTEAADELSRQGPASENTATNTPPDNFVPARLPYF